MLPKITHKIPPQNTPKDVLFWPPERILKAWKLCNQDKSEGLKLRCGFSLFCCDNFRILRILSGRNDELVWVKENHKDRFAMLASMVMICKGNLFQKKI